MIKRMCRITAHVYGESKTTRHATVEDFLKDVNHRVTDSEITITLLFQVVKKTEDGRFLPVSEGTESFSGSQEQAQNFLSVCQLENPEHAHEYKIIPWFVDRPTLSEEVVSNIKKVLEQAGFHHPNSLDETVKFLVTGHIERRRLDGDLYKQIQKADKRQSSLQNIVDNTQHMLREMKLSIDDALATLAKVSADE